MNLRYTNPSLDYSGYGEAGRHDIAALVSAGIDVSVELTHHCLEIADFGKLTEMVQNLTAKPLDCKIKILHTTPNIFNQFIEPNVYHIGRVFWETNKLPDSFARGAELCNEIWTGSEYNAQAIRNAGVNKPIYIIPEAIDTDFNELDIKPFTIPNKDSFNFYSIFEWTERKNPAMLLEAYWREFENDENVGLVLKTYVDNFTPEKKDELNSYIKQIKVKLGLTKYAPLLLYRQLMDRHQIYRFHKTFDCFVSAHRGEGWGIPQMEAMLMGKPVISTNCGGIHEHIQTNEAMLIPHRLIPLSGNNRNQQWYKNDQMWAEADIYQLRAAMRWIFTNRQEALDMAGRGKKAVNERFSTRAVGGLMMDRLTEIEKTLN